MIVLILGSGPNAVEARHWHRRGFDLVVAINNAHLVRPDWDICIFPEDFPADRRPVCGPGQRLVEATDYVPVQNRFGGFVHAGGTMAFTAGYWALGALAPTVIAYLGCDMVYAARGATHFYGRGAPDPLRPDVTLRSLEAKAARFMLLAARAGCAVVNLSRAGESRLVFPRAAPDGLRTVGAGMVDPDAVATVEAEEARLGYAVPTGRYWEEQDRFDPAELDRIDAMWLSLLDDVTRLPEGRVARTGTDASGRRPTAPGE